MEQRLVRIPRRLLHAQLDDLPAEARLALRPLLADLPLVPDSSHSGQLVGPDDAVLAGLAVLARHIGQGLRDHNLSLAHDRAVLRAERHKLVFLDANSLLRAVRDGDSRPGREAVLFAVGASATLVELLLRGREAAGLASFVAVPRAVSGLAHWRTVHL